MVVDSYEKNQDFYGRVLKDEEFRNKLMDLLLIEVYNLLNDSVEA
ncbi:hypothetical protein [Natroniella sp. ANB-PHB2]